MVDVRYGQMQRQRAGPLRASDHELRAIQEAEAAFRGVELRVAADDRERSAVTTERGPTQVELHAAFLRALLGGHRTLAGGVNLVVQCGLPAGRNVERHAVVVPGSFVRQHRSLLVEARRLGAVRAKVQVDPVVGSPPEDNLAVLAEARVGNADGLNAAIYCAVVVIRRIELHLRRVGPEVQDALTKLVEGERDVLTR